MTWIIPPVRGLIDPNGAPTYSIDGIGAIRLKDGQATIYYYENQPCFRGGEDQLVTTVIIKRRGEALVRSFATVATFAQRFMYGGSDVPPFTSIPSGNFTPRVVK